MMGITEMGYEMRYNKREMDILASIWSHSSNGNITCPLCKAKLILVQVAPIEDYTNAYTPYDTILECTSCSFQIRAESFTILGSVKDFDHDHIDIASWSPSGSRVISHYEHILDYELLKNLKQTEELVEFLIVNKHVIQIIG
ncbi:MAG: hypothetical protein JXA91_02970 [Candidatus Thermoplasmatota archaeon]|nr:hypothetical protein [Candidatus Thermoplasmatota archaeon]